MPIDETTDLLLFMKPFSDEQRKTALWLRDWVWHLFPTANELIYDNYNALAFGWSVSDKQGDTFCHIAMQRGVTFGLYRGMEIPDTDHRFTSNGKQARHIKVPDINEFPKTYIEGMLYQAHINALMRLKGGEQTITGKTIVKSISEKKRRPDK